MLRKLITVTIVMKRKLVGLLGFLTWWMGWMFNEFPTAGSRTKGELIRNPWAKMADTLNISRPSKLPEKYFVFGPSMFDAPISAHATRNVYSQLSGLEDVVVNDFIHDDFIPEGDGHVLRPFLTL